MNSYTEQNRHGDTIFDQVLVTPNQSNQKRRLREWENNAMSSSNSFITPSMTPDTSSTLDLTNAHVLSFVTHASDSEMDDMDEDCSFDNPIFINYPQETKRIRTDIETVFSSESSYASKHHPSENQKSTSESTEWWREKSRMGGEKYAHGPINLSSHGTRYVRNTNVTNDNECHICRTRTVHSMHTSLTSNRQSQLFSSTISPKRTKQKNSLLTYFNPTKSALSKTFSNTEMSQGNTRLCSSLPQSPPTCSYCDRTSCANCCKTCEQCQANFCTFCYTVNYESNVEKIMCFNCYESVTRSSTNEMDLS